MKVVVTGADGFLGWHTRVRLRARTDHDVVAVGRHDLPRLTELMAGASAVLHLAGVNRGPDDDVRDANVALARTVADAVQRVGHGPAVVFANSIQSGNGTPYGIGKEEASAILARGAAGAGSGYVDVRLPNLFGEHGRPRYNSFVATFVDAVIHGRAPTVADRPVVLLHAQDAAQVLIDALTPSTASVVQPSGEEACVAAVLEQVRAHAALYRAGDVPPLLSRFDVALFNTLRAAWFPALYPLPLVQRSDDRGALAECVRAHGGQGQTFVSSTRPGITRGEHFHLDKVERFIVLRGQARIEVRRLFHADVVSFDVSGEEPCLVDMPTMWAHNITNTGEEDLLTLFWTNTLFNPVVPDTYPEPVRTAKVLP